MKFVRLLLFAPLLMAFQCDEEINAEEDLLIDTGIYAGWALTSETVNGVTIMTPTPEMILEFYPDKNTQDNRGSYNMEEPSANTIGTFIMDQTEQTITFKREGKKDIVYNYLINSEKDFITFRFIESDALFENGWRKIY